MSNLATTEQDLGAATSASHETIHVPDLDMPSMSNPKHSAEFPQINGEDAERPPSVRAPAAAANGSKQFVKLGVQAATEFLGMFIFLFLALGGVQSTVRSSAASLAVDPTLAYLQIAMCFGFGLAIAVFFAYRISGGSLNPAVSFGLVVAGAMDPITFVAYTVAQMLGAMAGCGVAAAIFPGNAFKGANQVFAPTSVAQAFFLELILTFGLVLVVLFLAVEKSRITFAAPMLVGLYVFVAHILAIPYTNTSINPARSFGASVVSGIWSDHWIFWVAPLCGGALAGVVHRLYKLAEYETMNPGQDADS